MPLYRYAGTLLRIAGGALAKACCCIKRYWCVPDGLYCDMLTYTCVADPATSDKFGPYEENTCNYECPGPEECWPPVPYYCCYSSLDDYGQPVGGTYCQSGPCPSEALTASGPHRTAAECADKCRPHACVPTACPPTCVSDSNGTALCVPAAGGPYLTAAKCREACGCTQPCTLVSCDADKGFFRSGCTKMYNQRRGDIANTFVPGATTPFWLPGVNANGVPMLGGTTPAGGVTYVMWVDYEPNKPICVSYVSLNGKPIRVQILAPRQPCGPYTGGAGFSTNTPTAGETIRRDSGWRGLTGCDCPSSRPAGPLVGPPKGTLKWNTKSANVGWFHVRVFAPCSGSSWKIGVGCECPTIPEEPCCDCSQCSYADYTEDDDRVNNSYQVSGVCTYQRFDGILRRSFQRGPAPNLLLLEHCANTFFCEPENVVWKTGWPKTSGCPPAFWWFSEVSCWNTAIGPFRGVCGVPGNCDSIQSPAAVKRYWRYFVCENGVLVNRTADAVQTGRLRTPGGDVDVPVTTTIGGPALEHAVYYYTSNGCTFNWNTTGTDPIGQPGASNGGAISCPTALESIAPLDPVIVC
jgi:hypothetical protein